MSMPGTDLPHHLRADDHVLVVEPNRPLRSEDFDALAGTVDLWHRAHGTLRGVVVHTHAFPGWENAGSILRHALFIRNRHREIPRVALAADGVVAEMAPAVIDPLVEAEVRHFPYDRLDDAVAWASGHPPDGQPG